MSNTSMTPAEIATPNVTGLRANLPEPAGVKVYNQNPGSVNSTNPAGGYVGPKSFAKQTPSG
jgi:hypothetical protein